MTNWDIVSRMNRLDVMRRIYMNRAAAECGVYHGQPSILNYVEQHDRCTQCELAENMQVSPSSIATSVKRLQKAGLLQKIADVDDLRCNRLRVTPKGKDCAEKCRGTFGQLDARMLAGFSQEEMEQLCSFLDRMTDNLADEELKNKTMMALVETEKETLREKAAEKAAEDQPL